MNSKVKKSCSEKNNLSTNKLNDYHNGYKIFFT